MLFIDRGVGVRIMLEGIEESNKLDSVFCI